jgi:DNA-binding transcriptional ArsR family regulator
MTGAAQRAAPNVRASARLFAALGDETRLAVVTRLSKRGPASLTTLSEGARVTRQAVAKHLAVLSGAGLVVARRGGIGTVWELRPQRLDDVRTALDAIDRQWDAAIERLRGLVEE